MLDIKKTLVGFVWFLFTFWFVRFRAGDGEEGGEGAEVAAVEAAFVEVEVVVLAGIGEGQASSMRGRPSVSGEVARFRGRGGGACAIGSWPCPR